MQSWRAAHPEVVSATERLAIEELAAQCHVLLTRFDAQEILLSLITDENDDGWELAEWFVSSLRSESQRRTFERVLQRWASGSTALPQRVTKVVIVGGHPRDESKTTRRLFARSAFEIVWKTGEKSQRWETISEVLRCADAAIIITGMVSHTLMESVKRCANLHGVPWKCVSKATDSQLKTALTELFPNVSL